MSEPPHGNDGSLLDEILKQVDDALTESRLGPGPGRDALMEGVREAFSSLGLGAEARPPDAKAPVVEVVEGGRGPNEPLSQGQTPELRIADLDASSPVEADADPPSRVEQLSPGVTVRVLRAGGGPKTPKQPSLLGTAASVARRAGSIKVGAPGSASEQQTIFRGAQPRAYRLFCDKGQLQVAIDGLPADRLTPGQSMDIEAGLIRVSAGTTEGAMGSFLRLGPA